MTIQREWNEFIPIIPSHNYACHILGIHANFFADVSGIRPITEWKCRRLTAASEKQWKTLGFCLLGTVFSLIANTLVISGEKFDKPIGSVNFEFRTEFEIILDSTISPYCNNSLSSLALQTQGLSESSSAFATASFSVESKQIGWPRLRTLEYFCREFQNLEPKSIFFREKAHTLRAMKSGVGWLVGWAYGLLCGMYVMVKK